MDPQNAMFEGIKRDRILFDRFQNKNRMNPSFILSSILVSCLSAGALGSSTVSGPGQEQLDKVLRGFGKADSDKPHGMVLVSGPISSNEPETTGFASLFRHRRHHRRHIIHRHPVPFFSSSQGSEEGNHPSNPSPPTALLEVMKIRERIVVDEQNRPKSAELALSNDLMQIDPISGQIKMLRHGEIHIKPKTAAVPPSQEELRTGAGLIKSVGPDRTLLATEFGADGEPIKMPLEGRRLDRFIRYLHLCAVFPLSG